MKGLQSERRTSCNELADTPGGSAEAAAPRQAPDFAAKLSGMPQMSKELYPSKDLQRMVSFLVQDGRLYPEFQAGGGAVCFRPAP